MKLTHFRSQLAKSEMYHFPTAYSQKYTWWVESKYAKQVEILLTEFERSITFTKEKDIQLKLVEDPFSLNPEELPTELQLEVIELQASSVYKTNQSSLQDFYRSLDKKIYQNTIQLAIKRFSIFWSTDISEQIFSVMNINKNNVLFSLTNI